MSNATDLNLRTSNPTHSWKLILQQEVVGFIIKAPLADSQICTIAFDLKENISLKCQSKELELTMNFM